MIVRKMWKFFKRLVWDHFFSKTLYVRWPYILLLLINLLFIINMIQSCKYFFLNRIITYVPKTQLADSPHCRLTIICEGQRGGAAKYTYYAIAMYETSCGVNQSWLHKWLLFQNCLKINGTTLFSSESFPPISAGPQKPQKLSASKIKYEKFGPKILIPISE